MPTSLAHPDMPVETGPSRVRQTRKSIATRRRIIEATIQCFLDLGYHRTTTSEIAKQARLTRGAVQYYFPTTPEVLHATVEHIQEQFLILTESLLSAAPPAMDAIDWAIDKIWELAHSPLWIAWRELEAASRTDAELRGILVPAMDAYNARQEQLAQRLYKDFVARGSVRFDLSRQVSWMFLHTLASSRLGPDDAHRKAALVAGFKDMLHDFWGLPRQAG